MKVKSELNVQVISRKKTQPVVIRSDRLPPPPKNHVVLTMRVLEIPEPIKHPKR